MNDDEVVKETEKVKGRQWDKITYNVMVVLLFTLFILVNVVLVIIAGARSNTYRPAKTYTLLTKNIIAPISGALLGITSLTKVNKQQQIKSKSISLTDSNETSTVKSLLSTKPRFRCE